MKPGALILPFVLSGCGAVQHVTPKWEWVGITSTATHNQHVKEAEKFALDAVKNQGRLVEITHELNQEDIYHAKSEDDQAMLERAYLTKGKIQHAKEVSEELSSREFTRAPDPPFDWSSIIPMIMSALGLGGPLGLLALSQRSKIKDIANQAKHFAQSTEVNDAKHIEKYTK